ncbi:MAG: SulP family inorganic anion transporter [Vicinamibacterales bacterium]
MPHTRSSRWLPKSVLALRHYNLATLGHDTLAGVTVGLVALPLAMAFAIASGLPPQSGIYCAIVTGFIISALGGSNVQIGGPTGAFVVVVAGIVATYGTLGLFMCTMMAGVMLVVAGLTGTGTAVRFIPRPVVVGFTNGIAVLIASTQIRDFLGLSIPEKTSEFLPRIRAIIDHIGTITPEAAALATSVVVIALLVNRLTKRVPGTVAGLVVGGLAAWMLQLPIETVGSRFGGIPAGLPALQIPQFKAAYMLSLLSPALTIAILGAIESLMSAVVADRMSGDRHNPNVELIAQGIANIASPLFGGLPATGAIARTATNIRSGGRTPIAGIVHALTLFIILIALAPVASHVPMAVLAGLLMVVARNMGEWSEIPVILRQTKTDVAVWFISFMLTVFADLTVAVEVGMILAALLYIRRVSNTTTVSRVTTDYVNEGRLHSLQDKQIPDYSTIFRIHGPLLFGSTDKLHRITDRLFELPEIIIFRLRNMPAIDATGLLALEDAARDITASGRHVLFCGARSQPAAVMRRASFAEHVGPQNVLPNIARALERAAEIHAGLSTQAGAR